MKNNMQMMSIAKKYTKEEIVRMINDNHALSDLNPDNVYAFSADMSNQMVDSYHTRMHQTSLKNYAQDFSRGLPMMVNHEVGLPVGRFIAGEVIGNPIPDNAPIDQNGQSVRVTGYILRDTKVGEMNTNDIITSIDGGVIKDVSIRFNEGVFRDKNNMTCSVCGRSVMDKNCDHIPGRVYDGITAYAWIKNANAVEGSLVYKGSTPNAEIVSSVRSEYLKKGNRMLFEKFVSTLREFGAKIPDFVEGNEDVVYDAVLDEMETIRSERDAAFIALDEKDAEIEKFQPFVEVAKQYVTGLIDDAVKARVRAVGAGKFDEDKYRAVLEKLGDVEYIRSEISAWDDATKNAFDAVTARKAIEEANKPKDDKPANINSYKG